VPPAVDVRRAVGALFVADGDFDDFQGQSRRAENEVKISKRIKFAEIFARRSQLDVVGPAQDFRATECVLESLPSTKEKAEGKNLFPLMLKNLMASFSMGYTSRLPLMNSPLPLAIAS
jgi:hypothetical protein